MKTIRMRRRDLLRGLGISAAALPFVPTLEAEAGGDVFPQRLILLHTPDGTNSADWRPSGGESDFVLSTILSPLEDVRDDIVIVDGLRASIAGAGEAHAWGMAGLWTGSPALMGNLFDGGNGNMTGWGGGTSIDQMIADAVMPDTPYRSLQFGVQTGDPNIVTRCIYSAPEAPIHPEPSPYAMFDQLYANLGADQAELDRLRARKQSVIDAVQGQLGALENKVAAHDRMKIEAHLDAVRAIEQRLDADFSACQPPEMGSQLDINSNENFPMVGDLQLQLMVSALACDVTRLASFQWSRGFSGVRHEWIGKVEGHHTYSHNGQEFNNTDIDRWYAERFRDLILLLKSYPEGNGTMLDNTIVVWGREIPTPGHFGLPFPIVIAGGGGGRIATGRYLDYGDTPHSALLVSICNAMGMPEVTSVGTIDPDSGPLPGLVT
jgi:hypothetical protein